MAEAATTQPKPKQKLKSAVVFFAGDSGDGMQVAGTQFTNTSAIFGNDVATLPDFPPEIRAPAGPVAGASGWAAPAAPPARASVDAALRGSLPGCELMAGGGPSRRPERVVARALYVFAGAQRRVGVSQQWHSLAVEKPFVDFVSE